MQSEHFIFDGVSSEEIGLYIIRMDKGFISNAYVGEKKIKSEIKSNRVESLMQGVAHYVIKFDLEMVLLDDNKELREWTPVARQEVAKLLFKDRYCSFQSADDLGKVYYGMFTNAQQIFTMNGTGYLKLSFTTNAYTAWSNVLNHSFNFWNNDASGRIIEIINESNIGKKYKPKIEIEMLEEEGLIDAEFKIFNISNNNKEFSFKDLRFDEVISVDNMNGIIKSSYPININPYDNFNKQWFELVYGVNKLKIFGKCKINIQAQFPIMR